MFSDIEVSRNALADNARSGRAEEDLTAKLERFAESRNVKFTVPGSGATITYSPENIDANELNFKVNFASTGRAVEGNGLLIG